MAVRIGLSGYADELDVRWKLDVTGSPEYDTEHREPG